MVSRARESDERGLSIDCPPLQIRLIVQALQIRCLVLNPRVWY